MKFLMDNWMLLGIAIVSGGALLWPLVAGAASAGGLSPNGAVQLINRERGVVVDVSEPEEYAASHVGGAKNVPLAQFETRLTDAVKNKTVPLILVCPTGARAAKALPIARKLGYDQAQVLAGGLKAWKDANLPIEKS
ncbi:MAG: rhodanese-like domain-containing protein [Burkholderiaceae bacterium]|nr:rhodanese-like domain-containing protein [Burkholderiaceae bacterium]